MTPQARERAVAREAERQTRASGIGCLAIAVTGSFAPIVWAITYGTTGDPRPAHLWGGTVFAVWVAIASFLAVVGILRGDREREGLAAIDGEYSSAAWAERERVLEAMLADAREQKRQAALFEQTAARVAAEARAKGEPIPEDVTPMVPPT